MVFYGGVKIRNRNLPFYIVIGVWQFVLFYNQGNKQIPLKPVIVIYLLVTNLQLREYVLYYINIVKYSVQDMFI